MSRCFRDVSENTQRKTGTKALGRTAKGIFKEQQGKKKKKNLA